MTQNHKSTIMMKLKVLFLLTTISLLSSFLHAQRGVRIGYIDTEYILQNVPEYQEAATQLDKKVLEWKSDIEKRLNDIEQKKKELNNERVLLTTELYEERLEDISFEEAEILDIQQKRFGPNGDLMIQKRQLIEPIQDQIFAAVQEIAELKKYDFVFDKSADVVMLYSAERYDISEQVLKTITRTSRRNQVKNKEDRKVLEDEEVVPIVNEDLDERQKAQEDSRAVREAELATRRAEREKALEQRRIQQQEIRDARKREAEERRAKAIAAREKKSSEIDTATSKTITNKTEVDTTKTKREVNSKVETNEKTKSTEAKPEVKKDSSKTGKSKTPAELLEEERQQKLKEREARKKALEERKQKIIEQRQKAREEREKQIKRNDSIAKAKKSKDKENN